LSNRERGTHFAIVAERTLRNLPDFLAERLLEFTAEINFMATNQFENSRVSEGTLRTERHASREGDSTPAEPEISNMIAEGGPASREATIPPTERPRIRGLVAASTLMGNRVLKPEGEELGNIEEIMLDVKSGQIAYAVLSFSGFPAIGNKRFPVPWNALQIDPGEQDFILDIDRKTLEGVPDFDKDNWPDMADLAFGRVVHKHYGTTPYWERTPTAGNATGSTRVPRRGREHEPTTGYRAETRH
jgi:sporulation protein YlmC with PRC-barrel domain